jgi:hypothetical protein
MNQEDELAFVRVFLQVADEVGTALLLGTVDSEAARRPSRDIRASG